MEFINIIHVFQDTGGAGICQMMFSSSLVAIAGSGEGQSPRKVLIMNTKVIESIYLMLCSYVLCSVFHLERNCYL